MANNIEINEIKNQQPQLAINSISWLLGVSQKEEDIHNALVSIKQFHYTQDMVTKLLSSNALEQLVQHATVPLPSLAHDFWNHLDQVLPSHPIFVQFSAARIYLQTLISVWHHPSYFALDRPPAISEKHSSDREEKLWEISRDRKGKQSLDEESLQSIDSQSLDLLGDWLLFWRLLKQQHGSKVINLARHGYDLNIYVHIVCAEVCYHHLQVNLIPLYLPQNRGAFIDLHEILESVCEEGPGLLNIKDENIWLLLDTIAYVFSGIDNAPLELQGLPRTWFSPSQSPSLMRKETVFLLVQLLAQNSMRYNLVSKKILLCLQMLLPVPMVASSRRSFFLQCQKDRPSEKELFEQMNMTLEGLINVFIPQLNRPAQPPNSLQPEAVSPELHTRIASLALTQLIKSILKSDAPTKHYNSIFLALPLVYFDHVLITLEDMCWDGQIGGQVFWVHELIIGWYDYGLLDENNSLIRCINIFKSTLIPDWSELDLQLVVENVFNFLSRLWKNSDPFYGNLVSSALCDILDQSFARSQKNRKILAQFIEMQALLAVAVFLVSDECSEECRRKWLILCMDWEKRRRYYTPSAQEVYQFEGLKNAAADLSRRE
ncbi:hypothetical protein BDZ94DRAFT_1305797 [Collybia nuda]|uniref:Uncharacterized protein n=1 Tax=Collybia nuda TaxID=64659 RepID=A0A9P6CNR5_9AGAR|nr:hypothetical protein BDZ94DRAFT_1305797 [Collybia nuda]